MLLPIKLMKVRFLVSRLHAIVLTLVVRGNGHRRHFFEQIETIQSGVLTEQEQQRRGQEAQPSQGQEQHNVSFREAAP